MLSDITLVLLTVIASVCFSYTITKTIVIYAKAHGVRLLGDLELAFYGALGVGMSAFLSLIFLL